MDKQLIRQKRFENATSVYIRCRCPWIWAKEVVRLHLVLFLLSPRSLSPPLAWRSDSPSLCYWFSRRGCMNSGSGPCAYLPSPSPARSTKCWGSGTFPWKHSAKCSPLLVRRLGNCFSLCVYLTLLFSTPFLCPHHAPPKGAGAVWGV